MIRLHATKKLLKKFPLDADGQLPGGPNNERAPSGVDEANPRRDLLALLDGE